MKKTLIRPAIGLVAVLSIILAACTAQQWITSLEYAAELADTAGPVLSVLEPQAPWIGLIPGSITTLLNVSEGASPVADAANAITQLQQILAEGNAMLPTLTGAQRTRVSNLLTAIQQSVALFEAQYPPVTASAVLHAYARGFLDSPNPKTAKVKKLSKKDKAAIAAAHAHLGALQAALAKK